SKIHLLGAAMRLNLQSDYALRLLTHLAIHRDRLVTVAEVASRFRISQNHLMKVAHLLGRAGFIETVRGRSGGLRLAGDPAAIRVGDVVRQMEGDRKSVVWGNRSDRRRGCRRGLIYEYWIDFV